MPFIGWMCRPQESHVGHAYWVLDVEHREPVDGCYTDVRALGDEETVAAAALDLAVPVAALL